MPEMTLLQKVKLSLDPPITTTAFDSELTDLIEAAKADLVLPGITNNTTDPLVLQAVKTYVKINFGKLDPQEWDRLNAAYTMQKKQLKTSRRHRYIPPNGGGSE